MPKLPSVTAMQTSVSDGSSLPQREERRIKTALRVSAILGQFWQRDGTDDAVQAIEIEGWLDVLEPLTDREVRDAWASYQRSGPRTARGVLIKPDAGALYRIATAVRQDAATRHIAAMRDRERREEDRIEAERQAQKPSAETAARILREAGFRLSAAMPKDPAP